VTLGSVGYARVAEIVDPDNFINETLKSNNESISAPFIVRLPGNTTTVPTDATAGTLPSVASIAARDQAAVKASREAATTARIEAIVAARRAKHPRVAALTKSRKLERVQPPKTDSLVDKAISLGTEITKLPHQAISAIGKSI
jgi:hypothetical protein